MTTITIAAAIVIDEHGQVLLVRKRGTVAFMQPGGKTDPGEDAEACLARELREELGVEVASGPVFVGRFSAPAANEPDAIVDALLYHAAIIGVPSPAAEIDAIIWLSPDAADPPPLAPLTRDVALPMAARLR